MATQSASFARYHFAFFPDTWNSFLPKPRDVSLLTKEEPKAPKVTHNAIVAKPLTNHQELTETMYKDEDMRRPDPEKEAEITMQTKRALEQLVNTKIQSAQPVTGHLANPTQNAGPKYIRYTPSESNSTFGAKERIIRMTEMQQDPLEPPKFQHKKVPRGPPSPPVAIMHSPPRKLTAKDQQDWKIPPCISNWKNAKGYTIPLDKRLAADGRGLQEHVVNDNFAKLSEALYIAERSAREEVAKRSEVDRRLKLKDKEKKEEMLRKLAQEARMERTANTVEEEEEGDKEAKQRVERDQIREERRRERERELRIKRNKSTAARDLERDIGERIALGQAVPVQSQETLFDQRLFNQSEGLAAGFGDDEDYTVYSKPLFKGNTNNYVYRPKKGDEETYGTEEDYNRLLDTSKFKPDKGFAGTEAKPGEAKQTRNKPVEFEKTDEVDPFGLDEFLSKAKGSSKPLDNIGQRGHMNVASGNAKGIAEGQGTKRERINFQSSTDDGSNKKSKHR